MNRRCKVARHDNKFVRVVLDFRLLGVSTVHATSKGQLTSALITTTMVGKSNNFVAIFQHNEDTCTLTGVLQV